MKFSPTHVTIIACLALTILGVLVGLDKLPSTALVELLKAAFVGAGIVGAYFAPSPKQQQTVEKIAESMRPPAMAQLDPTETGRQRAIDDVQRRLR